MLPTPTNNYFCSQWLFWGLGWKVCTLTVSFCCHVMLSGGCNPSYIILAKWDTHHRWLFRSRHHLTNMSCQSNLQDDWIVSLIAVSFNIDVFLFKGWILFILTRWIPKMSWQIGWFPNGMDTTDALGTTDTLPPGVDDRRQKTAAAFGWAFGVGGFVVKGGG